MVSQVAEQLVQRAENRYWVIRHPPRQYSHETNAFADVPYPHYWQEILSQMLKDI